MNEPRSARHAYRLRTTAGALFLLACLALLPAASASPASATSPPYVTPPPNAWAYTGYSVEAGSGSVDTPGGNFSYDFHGAYGESVVISQTNTSATTYSLQGTETLGTTYFVTLCTPNCNSPTGEANITQFSWMQDEAFANLTTTATVTLNGTAVPAIGLVNDHSVSSGNMTRLLQYSYSGSGGWFQAGTGSSTGFSYGSVATSGAETLDFTPDLGIQPVNTTPGAVWTASAAYTGSLSTSANYHLYSTQGGMSGSGSPSMSATTSGNLTMVGGDLGRFVLGGGTVAQRMSWQYNAPFVFWDGIFLTPSGSNLFLGSGNAWESQGNLGVEGAPSSADWAPGAPHQGWVSGATSFSPDQISVPAMGPRPNGGGLGPFAMASSRSDDLGSSPTSVSPLASGPGSVTLQTQPASVSDAEGLASALEAAPAFAALAPLSGGHGGLGFVLLAVVAIAVVVAMMAVRRQKKASARPVPRPVGYAGYASDAAGEDEEEDDEDPMPSSRSIVGDGALDDLV